MSTLRVDTLETTDGSFTVAVEDILSSSTVIIDDTKAYKVLTFAELADLVPSAEGDVAVVAYRHDTLRTKHSALGGGVFVAVSGTATEDSGTIVQSTGFYWKRVQFTSVTPQMFGAVVDGSTDDGDIIRLALTYAQTNNVPLYLPAGSYLVGTGTLTVSVANTRIYGDGMDRTNLYTTAGLTAFTISPAINGTHIHDMLIQSVGTSRTSGSRGVYANGVVLSTGSIGFLDLERLHVVGYYDAFNLQYCQLGKVHGCIAELNVNAYYSKLSINMRVFNNKFNNNYGRGIYLNGDSSSVSFSAGTLCSNNEIVLNGISSTPQVSVEYNEHFTLSNNMIDVPNASSTYNVHVVGSARGTISSCWIGASASQGVRLESSQSIMVTSNNVVSCTSEGIVTLGTSAHNVISSNVLESNGSYDILLAGSGLGQNVIGNNCFSSTSGVSIQEASASLSNLITSNLCEGTISTGSSTTIANNKTI